MRKIMGIFGLLAIVIAMICLILPLPDDNNIGYVSDIYWHITNMLIVAYIAASFATTLFMAIGKYNIIAPIATVLLFVSLLALAPLCTPIGAATETTDIGVVGSRLLIIQPIIATMDLLFSFLCCSNPSSQ